MNPIRVGQIWSFKDSRDRRQVQVVCVNDRRAGVRNILTNRLSYIRLSGFYRLNLIDESHPLPYRTPQEPT